MNIDDFSGKKVTVMGLGFHQGGAGVAQFFAQHGAIVTVTDLGTEEKFPESLEMLAGLPIRYVLGRHEDSDFTECDMVIRNPAVPDPSPYLEMARTAGVRIEMESSLFMRLSPSRKIIAVTGTKGKSTTTHMISHILKSCGQEVFLMGNMGKSMLGSLQAITADSWVVLELSSYQCEGFAPFIDEFRSNGFGPLISVITNLYPDHLNRYVTMDNYAQAKKWLLLTQNSSQYSYIYKSSEWSSYFADNILSAITYFDENTLPTEIRLHILGSHNRINAGCVYAIGNELQLPVTQVSEALSNFDGVEHRLEFVRELNGITFVNDSTATNPSAALLGMKAIAEDNKTFVVIVGGNDKNMDYTEFINYIRDHSIHVIILQGTADIHLKNIPEQLIIGSYSDYAQSIREGYTFAREAQLDCVLLSPAATSFNMFRDEFDRGRKFKEIVKGL